MSSRWAFYRSGTVPLLAMALIDLRPIGARGSDDQRLGWHAGCVAMIFGKLDPTALWSGSTGATAGTDAVRARNSCLGQPWA